MTSKKDLCMRIARILSLTAMVLAVGAFAHYARNLFLKYPPVWPDEALWADTALNLLRRGEMGSHALAGTLMGIEHHNYMHPPLYFLYLAGWFRLWGPSLIIVRLSSIVAAVVVMVTTYFLGAKIGLDPWLSLLPPSLLAIDPVFLRSALVGRMDMLALALIVPALLVVVDGTGLTRPLAPRTAFSAGLLSGLAMLTHAIGLAAPLAVLPTSAIPAPRGKRATVILTMLAGLLVSLLPWAFYALQDPRSFLAQMGAQFARKGGTQPFTATGFTHGVLLSMGQYGWPLGLLAGLMWGVGLVGLFHAARLRKGLFVLPLCQILLLSPLATGEIWYPVYAVPLTALGVTHIMRQTELRLSPGLFVRALTLILVLSFARGNLIHLSSMQDALDRPGTRYGAWCEQVAAFIPFHSRVLLSVIPDPYFGLLRRPDLDLKEFLPERIPIDEQRYSRFMGSADYIVVGPSALPSSVVSGFASSRGQLVAIVGTTSAQDYVARIYKISR